jgi:hypothetical protein
VPNRKGFTGLLSDPPQPLPDEDSSTPGTVVDLRAVSAEERPAPKKTAKKAAPAAPVSASQPEPEPVPEAPVIAAPPKVSAGGQTGTRRAATSIRIHQSVADDLEAAWLKAKSVDLRLSYSEFASRLLRRALQDETQDG